MLHARLDMADWNMETQLMPKTTLTMEIFLETILTRTAVAKHVLLDTLCLT